MKKNLAFLGLGRMGGPMARNLLRAGHRVRGYDPDAGALERARAAGVEPASSPAEAARGAEVVLSSLPDDDALREAYLSERGALLALGEGAVVFDLSTVDPEVSREVAAEARRRGVSFLDTPVSGSVPQAESATLAIMVGGEAEALARHRDVLEVLGSSVTHMGENGAGLVMKLATNLIFATSLCGIAEGLSLGRRAGLDPRKMVEVLRRGAVPKILDYKGMAMVERDYATTFPVRLMRKDLRLIAALAERLLSAVPLVSAARQVFVAAEALGFGEADQNAIIEVYGRLAGEAKNFRCNP